MTAPVSRIKAKALILPRNIMRGMFAQNHYRAIAGSIVYLNAT